MTAPPLIIVNERAGSGAMADVFRRAEHRLIDLLGSLDVAFTEGPGHATELTRAALLEAPRLIIVGGGDGTLNECVNGFFAPTTSAPIAPTATLALLSGGTGGDFRKTLGLHTPDDALAALAHRRTRTIDVGRVTFGDPSHPTHRLFINIASFGLSGRVDQELPAWRHTGGPIAYFGATLKSLWGWKNPKIHLTVDGTSLPPEAIATVAVGNGRFFGGGMKICPEASLDSGTFDVTVLGDLSRVELLLLARSVYDGTHVLHPKVRVIRATTLSATPTSATPVFLDIDGEPLGALPAQFDLLPQALTIIAP